MTGFTLSFIYFYVFLNFQILSVIYFGKPASYSPHFLGRGGLGGGTEESETQTELATHLQLITDRVTPQIRSSQSRAGGLTYAAAGGLTEPSRPLSPLAGGTPASTVAA